MSDEKSAPSAPAAQGLEVVAWQDAENPLYTTGKKRQMHGWATDGYPIVELVRLSDATAVIDQLRERVAELEAKWRTEHDTANAHIMAHDAVRAELAALKSAPVMGCGV